MRVGFNGCVGGGIVLSEEGVNIRLPDGPLEPFFAKPELRAAAFPIVSSFAPSSESSSSVVSKVVDIDFGELEKTAVPVPRL